VTLNSSRPRWWHEYVCLATPSAGSEDMRREISPRNRSLCRFVNYAALAAARPLLTYLIESERKLSVLVAEQRRSSHPLATAGASGVREHTKELPL